MLQFSVVDTLFTFRIDKETLKTVAVAKPHLTMQTRQQPSVKVSLMRHDSTIEMNLCLCM
jgi:hypothetical protein